MPRPSLPPRRFPRRQTNGRLLHDQAGLVLLFWAFSFVGLLAFLIVVADSGLVFVQKRGLQNAADAGALAGAQALVVSNTQATLDAQRWAASNESGLVSNDVAILAASTQVKVDVSKNAPGLFDGTLGFGEPLVRATATAEIASLAPGQGVVPIGIAFADLVDPGIQVELKHGPGDGSNAGFVDIDGSGATDLRAGIISGSANPLTPLVDTETGQNTGPTVPQALEIRLRAAYQRSLQGGPDCFSSPTLGDQCHPLASYQDVSIIAGEVPAGWLGFASDINGDGQGDIQATAYVLLPVIVEPFTEDNGKQQDQHVYFDSYVDPLDGGPPVPNYELAMFWIDWGATFGFTNAADMGASGRWRCSTPDCVIFGQFVESVNTTLVLQDDDDILVGFDPSLGVHVVRLIA